MSTDSGNLYIGNGVIFSGSITTPNSAIVHGEVTGDLSASKLLVGKNAIVTGDITANSMEIAGQINENVKCEGLLTVKSTGQVNGSLEFQEIQLESGGVIKGKVNS